MPPKRKISRAELAIYLGSAVVMALIAYHSVWYYKQAMEAAGLINQYRGIEDSIMTRLLGGQQ